jgi:hypothetical protein
MFLLDAFLEVDEIRCFEVNYEVNSGGPVVAGMIPYFQQIQDAGRALLIRGTFTESEMRELLDALDPRGLYIYVMVTDAHEIDTLRPLMGM